MEVYSKYHHYKLRYHAKSGCTLVRQLFLEIHGDEVEPKVKETLDKWHDIQLAFPLPQQHVNLYTINVVRNPYKRVVSMFVNRICGGPKNNMVGKKFGFTSLSFYQFVMTLMELKMFKGNLLGLVDDHIVPQSINFAKSDKVVKLENIEEELGKVLPPALVPRMEAFFTRKDTLWKNHTNYDDESVDFVGTKPFSIDYEGPWPNYKCFYNEDLMFLVHRVYAHDFACFGYDPNVLEP